ncbi:hypothetical protein HYPSUDRAFT_127052 [Hypholoma sublateritium FD-334 SS-4]|uniref:DUF6533 domain-containing protein n=1 Tax=Hypholoma sublateritium (strain FD-334 SS-4) TaxID=945553 RepID=A0A0D2QDN5_HYPSF|nr:hypothetical protein HYPSUDRAFT_127052 [Hypholoma sublateritium FD-334 SS-4]
MVQGVLNESTFVKLYKGNIIPLNACLPGLTWVLHDYLITIEDEIRYVWPAKKTTGRLLFFWIRYYGIFLLFFDVIQIHVFSIPGITSDTLCVAMDSIIRIVGALSLWAIEIVMQMRIYALYKCSRRVALINAVLFLASIGVFLWILSFNALRRREVIAEAIHYPLPGCPSVHSGIEWLQWIPATVFESILFFWALYKTLSSTVTRWRGGQRISLYHLILRDNISYFFGITCLLIFNNLMVVGVTKIPWFSYSPFHAAMEIMTSRMIINLYKIAKDPIMPVPSSTEKTYVDSQFGGGPVFLHTEDSGTLELVDTQFYR